MKISSIDLLANENKYGLAFADKFEGKLEGLNNIVVLTGGNGSGKSRFLKLLQSSFVNLKHGGSNIEVNFKVTKNTNIANREDEKELTRDMAQSFTLVNYSHFDAKLQETGEFSPYVIHQARNKLKQCNYEETALNSLLYLKDLAEGYSEDSNELNKYKALTEFITFAKELELDFSWNEEKKELKIFNRKIEEANLSPGQLYALRIAVACTVHEADSNFVFLLDEPETHLHPSLLVKIVNKLMEHFEESQFFIATHSLPLISYLTVVRDDTTVFYMENGKVIDKLRSNSEPVLNNLIGTEDDQFAIRQLFLPPEEMAYNKFCVECFFKPTIVRGGVQGDPSALMAEDSFSLTEGIVNIVDYGAGEGRLFECMYEDGLKSGYKYNAYNVEKDLAKQCEKLITFFGIEGKSYFDKESLAELYGKVDRVFMVNVLHEISPVLWKEEFETIFNLLKDTGKLVIIEREILTVGESPYANGYLMLTGIENKSPAAEILFGKNNFVFTRLEKKPHIIGYTIDRTGVNEAITAELDSVLEVLADNAILHINRLKKNKENMISHIDKYKNGLNLAFWLNQLSCSILCREELKNSK